MSDKIELNRRRVLGGLVTIGAAGAAVGAGTFAAFSDTEETTGNSIQAGTLDLEFNENTTGAISIGVSNAVPGETQGYLVIELTNSGSIQGDSVSVSLGDASSDPFDDTTLRTDEEGVNPESETDDTADGELDDYLEVGVYIDDSDLSNSVGENSGTYDGSTATEVVPSGTKVNSALGTITPDDESLGTNESKYLVVTYNVPEETDNDAQGDIVEFDIQVELNQT